LSLIQSQEMVSQLPAAETSREPVEISVGEFGAIKDRLLDPSRSYQARIYRWTTEQMQSLVETLGFNARFEIAGVRAAHLDIAKNEGHIVLEINRNTKPIEVGVRFMADRWRVFDVGGKKIEGVKPFSKTEYHARVIEQSALTLIAQQTQLPIESLANYLIRFNFKDRTFGLITEDQFAALMPAGSFSAYDLPGESLVPDSQAEDTANSESANGGSPDPFQHSHNHAGADMMTQQPETIIDQAAESAVEQAPAEFASSEPTITIAEPPQATTEPVTTEPTATTAPASDTVSISVSAASYAPSESVTTPESVTQQVTPEPVSTIESVATPEPVAVTASAAAPEPVASTAPDV
jgi:hypothetical protein